MQFCVPLKNGRQEDKHISCERMENIYLQIIQLWLFIQALITEREKDALMAEQHQSISESLDIELDSLSAEDKINLIGEIADALPVQQLRAVREMIDQKRLGKLDEVKAQMIEEMRDKFLQLDLDFDEVMGLHRRQRRMSLPPKYRSPEGKTWSGRGYAPAWIREYEEAGGDREDYLIKDEA